MICTLRWMVVLLLVVSITNIWMFSYSPLFNTKKCVYEVTSTRSVNFLLLNRFRRWLEVPEYEKDCIINCRFRTLSEIDTKDNSLSFDAVLWNFGLERCPPPEVLNRWKKNN